MKNKLIVIITTIVVFVLVIFLCVKMGEAEDRRAREAAGDAYNATIKATSTGNFNEVTR